jgi:hypothetical protein
VIGQQTVSTKDGIPVEARSPLSDQTSWDDPTLRGSRHRVLARVPTGIGPTDLAQSFGMTKRAAGGVRVTGHRIRTVVAVRGGRGDRRLPARLVHDRFADHVVVVAGRVIYPVTGHPARADNV